jgi:hypothetical protein
MLVMWRMWGMWGIWAIWARRHRRALVSAALAAGAVVLAGWLVLYVLPPSLVPAGARDPAQAESDARTALIQGVAGLVLLGGLFFTYRTLLVNRETLLLNRETLELDRQGQITDRFSKAIEQLGDEKLDVRLGGIYALERIARDSANDHPTVMEVLTAFVRVHSAKAAEDQSAAAAGPSAVRRPLPARPGQPLVYAVPAWAGERQLRSDLSAIVTVLSRRRVEHESASDRINLRAAQLKRADFRDAQLKEAAFYDARLEGADFRGAQLEGATFQSAELKEASFRGAQLEGADFLAAGLEGAAFWDAQLKEAEFTGAQRKGAKFGGAQLKGATFSGAQLWGANFRGGRGFGGAQLEGADFRDALTEGAKWPEGFEPPGDAS